MTKEHKLKSRLEINYSRLLQEAQLMANGVKPKGWQFESDRHLTILYGSETGTAQDVAERIAREAYRNYFTTSVCCLNDMNIKELAQRQLAVFVVSTTGQGDDPDNMKEFFKSLWEARRNRQMFSNLSFGVIGLGDSSYQKFNFAAKRLNKLLMVVGGKPLVNIGLGDDQHDFGPDFVVDSWLNTWWDILREILPLPDGIEPMDSLTLLPPKYKATFSNVLNVTSDEKSVEPPKAKVISNERVTSEDHFQDVRLIDLDISDLSVSHKPGDVLVVQPENSVENVTKFLELLNLDGDAIFTLEPWQKSTPLPPYHLVPRTCTIFECIQKYLDIMTIPKRLFFEILSFFTTDELEKEKFIEFTKKEGQEDLHNYCTRPRRSILEVLADFPSTPKNIPFDYLFDLIPPIRSRSYSIASSSLAFPNRAQLLVAVVSYKTILKAPRIGLCSTWLSKLSPGDKAYAMVKPGSLRFPNTVTAPIIMIGPGTGSAPFRAYIQECVAENQSRDLVMVFGCRNENKDHFFKDEWNSLDDKGLIKLFCAFSRDQSEKIYIQHVMKSNAKWFWEKLANPDCQILYAGNAKRIPIDVREALEYICEEGGGLNKEAADEFMKKSIDKRYQSESWA